MNLCDVCLNYDPATCKCDPFGERLPSSSVIACTEKRLKHNDTGRWVFDSDHVLICSECETPALQRTKLYLKKDGIIEVPFVRSNYCPNCGAYMVGGEF